MKFILVIILIFNYSHQFSNADDFINVLIVHKDSTFLEKNDMHLFSESGFYLYKNIGYNFILKDNFEFTGRVKDIKKDSIFISNKLSPDLYKDTNKYEILALHYKEIKYLKLLYDDYPDRYVNIDLNDFEFIFQKDTEQKYIEQRFHKIYNNSNKEYEIIPIITYNSIDYYYINYGQYFKIYNLKNNRFKKDDTYIVKNYFWFTPNYVDEINGLSLGFWNNNLKTKGSDVKDTFKINGVNINLNPAPIFFNIYAIFYGYPFNNYVVEDIFHFEKFEHEFTINGLNIEVFGLSLSKGQINGVNINGGYNVNTEINGVSIALIANEVKIFNGLNISILSNRSLIHKGVQIALINRTKKLKGVQIGIWNINEKRSLPFINWNFSD